MPRPLFRNASSGPGFLAAPKPIVWTRIDSGRQFECDAYPGAWAEAMNEEAEAIVAQAIETKKRKTVEAAGKANLSIVQPPTQVGMASISQPQFSAPAEPERAPDRPAPRRRAAKADS